MANYYIDFIREKRNSSINIKTKRKQRWTKKDYQKFAELLIERRFPEFLVFCQTYDLSYTKIAYRIKYLEDNFGYSGLKESYKEFMSFYRKKITHRKD